MTKLDRTKSVGGSDVAAILGLSPWRTPLDERAEANELAIRAKLGDAEMAIGFLSGKPLVSAKVVSRAGYTTNVKPTSYRSLTVAKNWRDL